MKTDYLAINVKFSHNLYERKMGVALGSILDCWLVIQEPFEKQTKPISRSYY
jgi:hypothetical protein